MSAPKKTLSKSETLYDPTVQLEKLDEAQESRFQSFLRFLSRSLLGGVALLVTMTLIEGYTGWLSELSGNTWIDSIHRLPSSIGGQGSISASAVFAMVKHRFSQAPVRALFVGDSVFAPQLGGGAAGDMPIGFTAASQVPDAMNLSQECWEWGMLSMLIRKLGHDPAIEKQRPLLVLDIDYKYFAVTFGFAPPFPVELELCAEHWSTPLELQDPDFTKICSNMEKDWPPTLREIAHFSPFMLKAIQGQLDFFMTFGMRSPVYESNERGFGKYPFRTFTPGIVDGMRIAKDYHDDPPDPITYKYPYGGSINKFIGSSVKGFADKDHPKYAYIRSLAKTVAQWPGPVAVIWLRPSVNAEAAMLPENKAGIDKMEAFMKSLFLSYGKKDLGFYRNHDFMPEGDDYADSDHLSAKGHHKLAEFVKGLMK